MMITKYLTVAILLSPVNVVSLSLAEEEENPILRVLLPHADKNPAPSPSISTTSNNMSHFPSVSSHNEISCMEEIVDKSPPASPIPLFTKDGDINDVPLNVLAIACGAILSSSKSKTSPTLKPIIWSAEGDDFKVSNDGVKLPDKIIWGLEADDFRTQEGTGSIILNKNNGDSGGPFGIWQLEADDFRTHDISVNMPDIVVAERIWEEEAGDFIKGGPRTIVQFIWQEESGDFIVQVGKVTYSVRNNIKQKRWVIANEGSDYRGYQKRNIRY